MADPGDTQDGAPEVSADEVEAAARAIQKFQAPKWEWDATSEFWQERNRDNARAALKAAYAERRDTQDGTERLAQLITQALIECGDELRREGAKFPTAVALMEEVGRRVAAQVTQDGTEREGLDTEQPTTLEELTGAVARGWCHPEHANKTMDEALAMAIVDEVFPIIARARQALLAALGRAEAERDEAYAHDESVTVTTGGALRIATERLNAAEARLAAAEADRDAYESQSGAWQAETMELRRIREDLETSRDEDESVLSETRRQLEKAHDEGRRWQEHADSLTARLAAAEAVVEAAERVGDSNFRRLETDLRRSGWPVQADHVQTLRKVLEDRIQASYRKTTGSPKGAERIDRIPSHKSPPDDGITYLQIDRLNYRVNVGDYTGQEVRRFAHPPISAERDLWLLVPGDNDHLIRDDDTVAIRNSGLRFFTTPKFINAGTTGSQQEAK